MARWSWKWTMVKRCDKNMTEEQKRRSQELEDSHLMRRFLDDWHVVEGHREISAIFAGTYGVRQAPLILSRFEEVGDDEHVGGILLLDLDQREADNCIARIPPRFRDRITIARCDKLPEGFLGCTIEDAEALKDQWYHDVHEANQAFLRYIDRHTRHGLLLVFASPGGHAAVLPTVLNEYHEHHPKKPVYVTTVLDQKSVVRKRFPKMRKLLNESGAVRGAILGHNLMHPERFDAGIQLLFPAMSAGSWLGSLPSQLGNALSYVFDKESNVRYATISVWAETIPVYHIPAFESLPEVFYTKSYVIEEKVTRGLKAVFDEVKLQSLPLKGAALGHTRMAYVIAPLVPEPDFATLAARIDANLAQWREDTDQDFHINYASIGYPLSPETTEVPLVIIFLQPLEDDGTQLDELALKVPEDGPKFLEQKDEQAQQPAPQLGAPANTTTSRRRGRPKGQKNGQA